MKARYDTIGIGYDSTRKADPFLASRMFHFLQATESGLYLDIGCGTGNYTLALHAKGLPFIGIDPSTEMLNKAKQKSDSIQWKTGKAEKIELESGSIDGVLVSLTIHHWENLTQGFREINRVLKEEGRMVLFTTL